MCSAVNDPSFYWKNNCDYNGGNILIGYGIKSLIQCAKACFNHKDCNYFTFVAHTCSLKNMRYLSQSAKSTSMVAFAVRLSIIFQNLLQY